MRFAVGTFPGRPSSTPGSCRICGIGRLRDGETGVVVTDIWIDMEGVLVFCEACSAEFGRQVPNHRAAELEAALEIANGVIATVEAQRDAALDIVRAQRAEMVLVDANAERSHIARIEAQNPGIDAEKVREQRAAAKAKRAAAKAKRA